MMKLSVIMNKSFAVCQEEAVDWLEGFVARLIILLFKRDVVAFQSFKDDIFKSLPIIFLT
jgi:hypothetical protein